MIQVTWGSQNRYGVVRRSRSVEDRRAREFGPKLCPGPKGRIRTMTFLDAPLQVSSELTKTMTKRKNRLPTGNAPGIEPVKEA
jgi:hypothetical protein